MGEPVRILLIEDSPDDEELVLSSLRKSDYDVTHLSVQTGEEMEKALTEQTWDIVICDYHLPSFSASAALNIMKVIGKSIPFIIVSGNIGEELATQAIKAGACDYVMKDHLNRLPAIISREMNESAHRARAKSAERELKEKDEQLRQAQKMEAIGRLAGGIAHDVNNVLAAIALYSDLALEQLSQPEKLKESLGEILKAQERAATMTRQLLNFSRKQVVQPRVFDLNTLIAELDQMLRRLIGEDIQLEIKLDPSPVLIESDPGQIEQIVLNLAINARDAMPKGGKLMIGTKVFKTTTPVSEFPLPLISGTYACVQVQDSGTGMDKDTITKIFEPFYTTKPPGKGTGLGLSTVYGIVKHNNGSVSVESEVGKGSLFNIYIPTATGTQVAIAEAATQVAPATPKDISILLVEDEDTLRNILMTTLEKKGYKIFTATNGVDALSLFEKEGENIDLVITDIVLPQLSGPEFVQRIKQTERPTRILFLSGYTDTAFSAYQLHGPAMWFLEKPFTTKILLQKINEILASSSEPV